MKISIVIPNFNGASLLEKNLPAVQAAGLFYKEKTGTEFEIIVSDDASEDASEETVKKLDFPVTFVNHQHNVGFSSNVNRGVKKANGDIIILLNSDVAPQKGFLVPLLSHFTNELVFAVGCLDLSQENGKEKKRGRGVGTWTKGFLVHRAGSLDKPTTLWASGGSSAFRKEIWDSLSGMLPLYNPFYWEDIDLSYRAQKAGYLVLFEAESRVIHSHDEGSIKTQFTSQNITTTAYRNQFYFVWLNITDPSFLVSHLLWLPYHLLTALRRRDAALYRGLGSALLHMPEVLQVRKRNKKLFKKTDVEILGVHLS